VKPPAEPAEVVLERTAGLNLMEPEMAAAPAATPDFTSRQDYLDSAPVGIDAPYAWSLPGGRGQGVKVIDCEWGWQLTHEDLQANSLGIVAGTNHSSTNHGTAVWGEIGGDQNTLGVTGIAAAAQLGASSFVNKPTALTIDSAANALSAGDVILLEIHRAGPNHTVSGTQQGYIGIEWWPDDFAAIQRAVNKGIIVVEAAGNGWEDLDSATYDTPLGTFPSTWRNPFRLANPQCGAVMVGAGNPPQGTHGRTKSPPGWNEPYVDRARCGFSNWGSRIDAQGWGWEVTSAGYGNLQGGTDKNRWYTDTFSGTSSASPIVTGALASVQGVLKAKSMPLLTSWRARQLLRSTGSPQQAAPGRPVSQRIGNRPNLRQLIPAAMKTWITNTTIRFTYTVASSQAAWAYVEGIGWRRIRTGSPDGVSNVFAICCKAQVSGKKVNVYIDDGHLYSVVQL
jgi:DNA-binding transcriptional LysR family regulator